MIYEDNIEVKHRILLEEDFTSQDINRAEVNYLYFRSCLEDSKAQADTLSDEDNYLVVVHEEVNDTIRLFRKYRKVVNEQARL